MQLIQSGDAYFDTLLGLIEQAVDTLHLQVYILDPDETGQVILHALKEAAARGVQVFLVADGFGSQGLGRHFPAEMEAAGIHFRFFSPWPLPGILQAGRRLHHKVVVKDGTIALVGGINIADKYRGDAGEPPWLDYALLTEGPVVRQVESVCERIFRKEYTGIRKRKQKSKAGNPDSGVPVQVRVSINDWLRRRNEISSTYKHMLNGAHREIIIMASYFTPTRRLLKILLRAAQRGRSIHIVLSRNSDVRLMKPAMEYLYTKLLRAGIQIYEYKEAVLHAKVCLVDERWVSIGSHNLNHLSELISVEMNLEVLDSSFAAAVRKELKTVMEQDCVHIRTDDYLRRLTLLQRAAQWLSYRLISWSTRLLYLLHKSG